MLVHKTHTLGDVKGLNVLLKWRTTPANCLEGLIPVAKLADFGTARLLGSTGMSS